MKFEKHNLGYCVEWCINQGYTVKVIPNAKYAGDAEMVVTDYVDPAREIVYQTFTLYFHNWKCTGRG